MANGPLVADRPSQIQQVCVQLSKLMYNEGIPLDDRFASLIDNGEGPANATPPPCLVQFDNPKEWFPP